jgi:hypothetical protein
MGYCIFAAAGLALAWFYQEAILMVSFPAADTSDANSDTEELKKG